MGQTVNLLAYAFGGSTPSLPTDDGFFRRHGNVIRYDGCGSNSVGRVTAFQAVGRGFESRLPLTLGLLSALLTMYCGNNSVGRVAASQAESRGFESRFPLND